MGDNDDVLPLDSAAPLPLPPPPQPIPRSRSRSRSQISQLANDNSIAFERDVGFKYIDQIKENDELVIMS